MQILTRKQVKYCRIVTTKSAALEYCLGIHFQDKLFISDKFFARDRQQRAIDYCQNRYLADGGKRSYILLANMAGLTVWQEDKTAQIIGVKSPEELIQDLELDTSIAQVEDIIKISISDRQKDSQTNKLINNLEMSLPKIIGLKQKVQDGYWLRSVGKIKPFNRDRSVAQFN